MSWTLLRKDLRLFRVPLVAGLALILPVYLICAWRAVERWSEVAGDRRLVTLAQPGTGNAPQRAAREALAAGYIVEQDVIPAALVGLGLTALLAGVFGGLAFAAERANRSAEFLAMLPLPRWKLAASKLVAAAVCLAVPVAVHVAVIVISPRYAGVLEASLRQHFQPYLLGLGYSAGLGVALFGVAWLLSALLDSPGLAVAAAAAVVALTLLAVVTAARRTELETNPHPGFWEPGNYVLAVLDPDMHFRVPPWVAHRARNATLAAGALSLLAGTAVYVRRVSP